MSLGVWQQRRCEIEENAAERQRLDHIPDQRYDNESHAPISPTFPPLPHFWAHSAHLNITVVTRERSPIIQLETPNAAAPEFGPTSPYSVHQYAAVFRAPVQLLHGFRTETRLERSIDPMGLWVW